ncbi:MAG: PAS domain S-box protein [Hydrogenophaga sp.]|nr:PAS domain S-box protein [Hydrogenophaga sp.]
MNTALRQFGHWLAMLSLRTQLLMVAVGLCLAGLLITVPVSLEQQRRQTEAESIAAASGLAMLVAHVASGPAVEGDMASLDAALQEFVALPGVRAIDVVGPGGRTLLRIAHRADGTVFTLRPRNEDPARPPTDDHRIAGDHLNAYASLLAANRGSAVQRVDFSRFPSEGWIDVDFSFAERTAAARQAWLTAASATLMLVFLSLVLFTLFLRRTIQPIRALAGYASSLARTPGETLVLRWGSKEVRELGRALNWSSHELARRIDETQQRLSRMHAILDTAADAIIGVDAEGSIVSANPAAERMFGRELTALQGSLVGTLLPDMDGARLRQAMADGMLILSTQSRVGRLEIEAIRHEGTRFPVEVLLGEIPDDREIRYTLIVRDLTDMKLAEEYLTLYGRVLDCTPNGISVSNARRYPQPIVHVNPAFTRITGYAAHEILGRDASLLEGPLTDRDDIALLERTVRAGGEIKLTLHNYRKDGSLFHNKLSVSPVRDANGEITHYINVIEDVTAQIEVKQRLIERTARLNATFDLSPDGFAVFDTSGELIASNPAFRTLVGEVPHWCSLQRFDAWFSELCEDPQSYRPVMASLNDTTKQTLVLVRPTRRVLERVIRRNLGGSGETFLYFRDVTHQFEVDRMKSEFLATAAHELRTPLASILGFTELMLHRKYSEERQKDLLQTVHRQGSLLNNLIQELLDLSRIEARQGKDFRIVPTRLDSIVQAAVQGITHQELGREVTLGELPEVQVMADASKIEQALINLLSNAFKYSPQGGEVSLDVQRIEHDGEEQIVIAVRDHGIGMTPEQLARAFERFYRADASGNIPGTGLGLNLVKEIAEIHGGGVELTSEPGVGTTASLRLKLAHAIADGGEALPA